MKIAVYDTYVKKDNGTIMHFDILVADTDSVVLVYQYGKEYLEVKGLPDFQLTTKECTFCHMETAPAIVEKSIQEKGYYIIEMQNC